MASEILLRGRASRAPRRPAPWGGRRDAAAVAGDERATPHARVLDRCRQPVRKSQTRPAPRAWVHRFMAKYGKKAGKKVKRALHEKKRGKLKSGRSGKKVKSRKQAIAIGLSEARRSGGKVPKKRKRKSKRKSRKKK